MNNPKTYSEFWPFYLNEHKLKLNRQLHFAGTTLGLLIVFFSVVTQHFEGILGALVAAYAFAWVGHFIFEKNRPATFKYPVWSFISDFKMWAFTVSGKLDGELKKYQVL